MSNRKETVKKAALYFIYAVAAIQTALAFIWLSQNITVNVNGNITQDYLEAAKTLRVDDYMGILYALIIAGITKVAGEGTCLFVVLYILQMLLVLASFLLLPVERKTAILAGLVTVTQPFILQAECTVMPYAAELACTVGILGVTCRYVKTKKTRDIIKAGLLLTALCLLNGDLVFAVLFIAVPGLIAGFIKLKKQAVPLVLALTVALTAAFGINTAVTEKHIYGRAEKSLEILMLQRVMWPDMYLAEGDLEYYYGFDDNETIKAMCVYPEALFERFGYAFESENGTEKAQEYYKYAALNTFNRGKGKTVEKIAADVCSYLFPAASAALMYINKTNDTHLVWNVSNFTEKMPGLSQIYLCFGTMAAILGVIFLCVMFCISSDKIRNLKIFAVFFYFLSVLAAYAACFCLRGFDYMYALAAVAGYAVLLVLITLHKNIITN